MDAGLELASTAHYLYSVDALWMLINGVHIIFIIPLILLVVIALVVGVKRFKSGGAKASSVSVVRILAYGGLVLFLLFIGWTFLYYSGGGH